MTHNKNHWYDGWFYDRIIAPNQDKLFGQIHSLIDPQSQILDVGCGTGRLAFALAPTCQSVLGIDLSKRNIDRANLRLAKQPNTKISFQHSRVGGLNGQEQTHFDYAVATYVIHEVNEEERVPLLKEIAQVADKIIIGDYLVPKSKEIFARLTDVIEFIAGTEHYRNYKSYMANGGMYQLAKKAGLSIIYERINQPSSNHLVVLTKQ
jgi:ubiquinone/menaquinone biosynthesis C-methylase UbiE